MTYDRSIRMFDEAHAPEKLDQLMGKGNMHRGKFLSKDLFHSYYLQMKTILDLSVDSVLEVGPGERFVADYMKTLGITYDTLDSDQASSPTILTDLRDVRPDESRWDVVSAFQVLEHMPFSESETNVGKLASASKKYVFISLPYHCFGMRVKLFTSLGQRKRYLLDFGLHLPTFFKNRKYRKEYMDEFPFAVHFWELGRKSFSKRRIERVFARLQLTIRSKFHSENPYHYFYLLEK